MISNEHQWLHINRYQKCYLDWTKVLPNFLPKSVIHKGRDTTIVRRQIDSPIQKLMDLASRSSRKEKWQKASLL
jgi:hypothetical protein